MLYISRKKENGGDRKSQESSYQNHSHPTGRLSLERKNGLVLS
jgi:hypothetical protein